MKKALTEILRVKTKQDKILDISIVEKQSELGLKYNARLFILVENQRFGYISNFKESDKPEDVDISKCKVVVPIKNITTQVERSKQIISINFYVTQDKKKVNKKWVLKMATEELAKQWQKLLTEQKNKSVIRKNQSASKVVSGDREISPKKSEVRVPNPAPVDGTGASHKNLDKVKQQIKQDFGKRKMQKQPQKQQHKNALYQTENKGTFILDSPVDNKNQQLAKDPSKINNSSYTANPDPNPKKKLTYDQESEVKKKLTEEIKREQQQKLRKQRQQIEKKQRELQQMQRKIKQQQRRIQEQKKVLEQTKKKQVSNQNINNNEKEVTVINENFFNKPKQDPKESNIANPIKQSQLSKQQSNLNKSKPKIEGPNYTQYVNNIILEKQKPESQAMLNTKRDGIQYLPASPKQKTLQQTHSYLLKLQQLKLQNAQNQQHPANRKAQNTIEQKQQQSIPQQYGWTYRYLLKQSQGNQDQIISQFKSHCCKILKQVVSQLHLPDRKRNYLPKYRREEYNMYQKDDIQFKIAFIGLKQIYNHNQHQSNNRQNICNQAAVKILQNQFKYYHLFYQVTRTVEAQVLRVPLTCLCQFQGFVGLFKARSQLEGKGGGADKKVQVDLEKVASELKIGMGVISNKDNVLIYKLNSQYYRELAAKSGKLHISFNYHIIEQLHNILPKGVLQPDTHQSQQQHPNIIRHQLLHKYTQSQSQNQNILDTIEQILKKVQKYKSKIINNSLHNRLSEIMLINIANIIKEMDQLEFYFVHPRELVDRMHFYGVNLRCLGLIYQHCQLKFNKGYLMTEMAARTTKLLFRKTIQDCHLKQSQEPQKTFTQNIHYQIIDFFNLILGSSNETVAIWKVLSTHNEHYFNTPIVIDQIQKGYFIHSLIYHCGINVQWSKIHVNEAFVSDQFFNGDNFVGVDVKSKSYEPVLNDKQSVLVQKIIGQDPTAIKILQQQYAIHTNGLPLKFRSEKYIDMFRKYLSNFVPPEASIQRGYRLLNLYNSNSNRLTKCQFYLKQMQLKWHLKRQRKQKYLQVFSELNSQIINCYGNFHPFLSQLYETMVLYHRNNAEYEDSITFSKSSVINMLKICGAMHNKVAESYYQLAFSCIKGGKKQQAIVSLQKSKNIFEANQKQGEISYAYVCMKLGLMFLSEGKDAQSIVKYALKLFNRALALNKNKDSTDTYEQQRVQCYEILSRYYQLNQLTQSQKQLSLDCQKQLHYVDSPTCFEKILKIVLYPLINSMNPSNAKIYLNLIAQIPMEINVDTYMTSFERIIQRVQEDSLIQNFEKYLENMKSIENFIRENHSLREWKGIKQVYQRETVSDFISLTLELIYFLGEGFVTGTLRDNL